MAPSAGVQTCDAIASTCGHQVFEMLSTTMPTGPATQALARPVRN